MVLLNCSNQLVMHILNARLRGIVEKAGILEPGQSGGRQGRSMDINLTKLEWVTRAAVAQGKRVYRLIFDTGVVQGSVLSLSPLLFLVFMNALLGLITDRGRKLHVSHGIKCGVQPHKKGMTQDTGQAEQVGQFCLHWLRR